MRYVWFKQEMKQAILNGAKTATTRDHALPKEQVLAVTGSRFHPEPFAILEITERFQTSVENVTRKFWREEGFQSQEGMVEFCKTNGLLQTEKPVFFHKFKLIKKVWK